MNPLPHFPLGNTGLSASPLGLGTVKWGRNQALKHGPFELPDDKALATLLDMAVEAGVNLLDTAAAYGIAEQRIGRILGQRREQFLLFSKTGEIFADGQSRWDFSAQHTRHSVQQSLKLLRTDRLDGVLLHCPRNDVEALQNSPALETLAELKAAGLIRSIGASVTTLEGGLYAVPLCDVLMIAWSIGFHEQQPVIEAAARAGKGVLLKKVFNSGQLALPADNGASSAIESCIHPALRLPGHPVVIVGTLNPAHFQENIAAARSATLHL
ncbi:MAG: aldo/keto reductase [Methylococcaceae bacterium]|nr:MAG: aldo/keto reductase [Methylococcaceae bacterium]